MEEDGYWRGRWHGGEQDAWRKSSFPPCPSLLTHRRPPLSLLVLVVVHDSNQQPHSFGYKKKYPRSENKSNQTTFGG